jgi:hypothetical protein
VRKHGEVSFGEIQEWLRAAGLGRRPGAAGRAVPAFRGGAAAERARARGGRPELRLAGDGPPGGRPGAWSAPDLRLVA